jgi:hypothetical protein
MNWPEIISLSIAVAVFAELAVALLAFPVAVIKRVTNLKRVKPIDCAMCLSFWFALAMFGPDIVAIALSVLARQIMHRLLLF